MLEKKNYYAVDTVFVVTTSFVDQKLGFKGQCELTTVSVQYSSNASRALAGNRDEVWVEGSW